MEDEDDMEEEEFDDNSTFLAGGSHQAKMMKKTFLAAESKPAHAFAVPLKKVDNPQRQDKTFL